MSGHVVRRPTPEHRCRPGWTSELITEELARKAYESSYGMLALPVGMHRMTMPDSHDYPRGTVWQCDECGRRWVSIGPRWANAPGDVGFRPYHEPKPPGRFARWRARRREKRSE